MVLFLRKSWFSFLWLFVQLNYTTGEPSLASYLLPMYCTSTNAYLDRVKFFWEKSSAGIEWSEFGESFEQGSSAGELAYPASAP